MTDETPVLRYMRKEIQSDSIIKQLLVAMVCLMLLVLVAIGYTHYEVKRQVEVKLSGLIDENAELHKKLAESEKERELLQALVSFQAGIKFKDRQLFFPAPRWDAEEILVNLNDRIRKMDARERGPMPREVKPPTNSTP